MDSSARIRDVSVNPNNPYKEEGVPSESVKLQIEIFLLPRNRLHGAHRFASRSESRCDASKSRCRANDIVGYVGVRSPTFLPPRAEMRALHDQHGVMPQILRDQNRRLLQSRRWSGDIPN